LNQYSMNAFCPALVFAFAASGYFGTGTFFADEVSVAG
jgi:hypothetical protein